jgi:hypothetical protein
MNDIRFKDNEDSVLSVDSYVSNTLRGATDDYAFVVLSEDPGNSNRLHTVGLTFAQAKNLAVFLIEELSK